MTRSIANIGLGPVQYRIVVWMRREHRAATIAELLAACGRKRTGYRDIQYAVAALRRRGIVKRNGDVLTTDEKHAAGACWMRNQTAHAVWVLRDEYASVNVA